jgi:hypothetical protein
MAECIAAIHIKDSLWFQTQKNIELIYEDFLEKPLMKCFSESLVKLAQEYKLKVQFSSCIPASQFNIERMISLKQA